MLIKSIHHLVGVGLAVGAADGLVVGGADAAAAAEHEVEVLQAPRDGRHVHVAAANVYIKSVG